MLGYALQRWYYGRCFHQLGISVDSSLLKAKGHFNGIDKHEEEWGTMSLWYRYVRGAAIAMDCSR